MRMRGCVAAAVLAAGALAVHAASAQVAPAQVPTLDQLPDAIKPPSGEAVYIQAAGTGVQIYTCGKNDAGIWAWSFKAPEADLKDGQQKPVGKHYAGPTWEGIDGGKVVGAAKANAPAPSANSIPWLLLDIKSRDGSGAFTQAQHILRVSTNGGIAPAQACDEAHSAAESRVPYTATYLFLK
jgi:hypothetical protein